MHKNNSFVIVLVIVALLIGFVAGIMSHDYFYRQSTEQQSWRGWYPR